MAVGAIGIAVAFLVAAGITMFMPEAARRGTWLPLHLALAGAATTGIADVMPFFAAAFAAAPPSDARLRMAAVGTAALGAAAVSFGVVGGTVGLAAVGGVLFVAGIGLVGTATVRPLGRALGPSRGLVARSPSTRSPSGRASRRSSLPAGHPSSRTGPGSSLPTPG